MSTPIVNQDRRQLLKTAAVGMATAGAASLFPPHATAAACYSSGKDPKSAAEKVDGNFIFDPNGPSANALITGTRSPANSLSENLATSSHGSIAPASARMESRPPVRMTPTRIPKTSAHVVFVQNSTDELKI